MGTLWGPTGGHATGLWVTAVVIVACMAVRCTGAAPGSAAPAVRGDSIPSVTPNPGSQIAPSRGPADELLAGDITVLAAASLSEPFKEIGAAFGRAHLGAAVTFNFGSSGTLATQLAQGARADVFASADSAQMGRAQKADALVGVPIPFARNRLALIVPSGNPAHIEGLADLAKPGVKFVTAARSVPVGQYTRDMLDQASLDPTYGGGFADKVLSNVVSNEADVKGIVAKVALGEADAGICYITDVSAYPQSPLREVAIPDALNQVAVYPVAVARGSNTTGGRAFVNFLVSPAGQAILQKWGFLLP